MHKITKIKIAPKFFQNRSLYIGSTMPGTLRAGIDNDRTMVNHIFNKDIGADKRGTMQINNIRKALLEQL